MLPCAGRRWALGGTQLWQKSRTIQSGLLPAATVSMRKAASGAASPSMAFLSRSILSVGTSAVDSAPSGSPSTAGSCSGMKRRRADRCAGMGGSLARFRGVDTKVTALPLSARRFESSRKGIMCPNASHGNTTTSSPPAAPPAAASIVSVPVTGCNETAQHIELA